MSSCYPGRWSIMAPLWQKANLSAITLLDKHNHSRIMSVII